MYASDILWGISKATLILYTKYLTHTLKCIILNVEHFSLIYIFETAQELRTLRRLWGNPIYLPHVLHSDRLGHQIRCISLTQSKFIYFFFHLKQFSNILWLSWVFCSLHNNLGSFALLTHLIGVFAAHLPGKQKTFLQESSIMSHYLIQVISQLNTLGPELNR